MYNHPWPPSIISTQESGINPETCNSPSPKCPYFKAQTHEVT